MAAAKPKLSRESLHQAMQPYNGCAVKKFIESLDAESREVLEEALSYKREDLSAPKLREWLLDSGFAESLVPGQDAILSHRAGRRPCRCRG